ncbi:PIG-L domain-containing protein [Clostridium sp. chh4-2]|uniref:PIG-L deacetylase family protein n=1 Tax=Clostridium sp. chh4-2 TaxID=2067550 RepID=UPI000CCF50E8|nr:PIG-L deacetylase family protein [Clostridium sp. chh4-2]PNV59276.1 PIG-L domain-containing protein [Clostridium sp. chh4-2]
MNILVFAPHPDDEILGVGGTMAREVAAGNKVYVCIITRGKAPLYIEDEETKKLPHSLYYEIKAAHEAIGVTKTFYLQHPVVMLETVPRYELNKSIVDVINEVHPDTVYIPHFGDMQKDHEVAAEAVMVAVRPRGKHMVRVVYAYETLSETEWNIPHSKNAFIPNTFVEISDYLGKKLGAMGCFKSQLSDFPNPRSLEAVESLAKLRGSTAGFKAAEAFALVREYRDLSRWGLPNPKHQEN